MATAAERLCVGLLLAYLVWVPMPFGSNVDAAFPPLIIVPIALCGLVALIRFRGEKLPQMTVAYRFWTAGAVLFGIVVAIQLLPLPRPLLSVVSPRSNEIWTSADRLASLAGLPVDSFHPIAIDPAATVRELLRLIALFAAMQAAALLIVTNARRVLFGATLILTALFEIFYGVREAALGRYAIWGWVNKLIFNRVTGTYVNPNHFAHYVALALPFTLFFCALAWRQTGPMTMPLRRRLVLLFEKSLPMFSVSLVAFCGCVAGILLAQSRGALAATMAGFVLIAIVAARRERNVDLEGTGARRRRRRATMGVAAGVIALNVVIIALVFLLGYERTVARFEPNETQRSTLVGRATGFKAAMAIWRGFPLFGSGLGTFVDVVSTVQSDDLEHIYQHAHNDYLELLATTGLAGFIVATGALLAGVTSIVREVMRRPRESGSWRRRAFEMAALWSVFIAMTHALFDFNFYIPANAATIAVIAGACVAQRLKGTRERTEPGAVPSFG